MSTTSVRSVQGEVVALGNQHLDDLQARIRGKVITPESDRYDALRAIWNGMIDRRPGLIVRCSGTADVIQAVRFARQNQLLTSVRGGGHNIAGKSLHDGALLIDLGAMNTVHVDPDARLVVAGPGATLADVDHETQAYGLAVPTGINSTTGIAGLTLGGGFGWTSRSLGLTADNLVAAEIVTADGERLHCDENNHADLFWAIRGGGGNFGVVTSFEFKLHPVGPGVAAGPIVFPFDEAGTVLRKYRAFCARCPDELTVWAVLRDAPPLPFLPPEIHGTKVLIVPALFNGPVASGEQALAELKNLGNSLGNGFGIYPFAGFQQAFDALLTPGARNYWKSHNFTELSDGLIDTLIAYASRLPSSQSEIFIAQMGGATNRIPSGATAYPHRDVEFIMNVHTRWDDADQDTACIDWAREFHAATETFATGGVYVNFISEGDERIEGAYGSNYDRLSRVKSTYDPGNFFRVNQNVRPQ